MRPPEVFVRELSLEEGRRLRSARACAVVMRPRLAGEGIGPYRLAGSGLKGGLVP
jgi:hypothetical protein